MKVSKFLTPGEEKLILTAIQHAELKTSGEIRVHIESNCKIDVLDRATQIFADLKMHKTELRNGVLFYLAIDNKSFAILGDGGINSKVHNNFWDQIKEVMTDFFKIGKFGEGLAKGIEMAGDQLKTHFPRATDDVNELSDEISYGK